MASETNVATMRRDLLAEQRRLAKLWDAFQKQDDEYRALETERNDLWSRVQDLEKASSAIGDPTKTYARLRALEQDNERLRADVSDLGTRLEEYRTHFNEEQERLAKLFKVYEDTEVQLAGALKETQELKRGNARLEKEARGATQEARDNLSKAELAQRKYAAEMKAIRARAANSPGGKGPIAKRAAAGKARAKFEPAKRKP